jgi:UDP-N-acetylmuramate--alanine ligase
MKGGNRMEILNNLTRFFLIGIGGAGMSAIALILKGMGACVEGSDLKESRYTGLLEREKIKVFIGHNPENISGDVDAVVYSTAITGTNTELISAKKRNIPVYTRGEILSWILNSRKGIAITGTHGKTTTTSMVSMILMGFEMDPIIIIGGELNELGSNARYGDGEFIVAEACESDGTFLKYRPFAGVITNVEDDHLDYWKDINSLRNSFLTFLKNIKSGGFGVIDGDERFPGRDAGLSLEADRRIYTFGLDGENDISAYNMEFSNFTSTYTLRVRTGGLTGVRTGVRVLSEYRVKLNVPGIHNIKNSLAALAVIHGLGLDVGKASRFLEFFTGAKRRFEKRGEKNGALIFDDYAHHPTEVEVTIQTALNEKNRGRIITVFQPHRYTRLLNLHDRFGRSFEGSDILIISDIFGSGESPIPGITGKLLIDSLLEKGFKKRLLYIPRISDIKDFLADNIEKGDIVLIVGAGDITRVTEELLRN